MVFLGKDSTLTVGKGMGYHHSESNTAFWAAVPLNAGPTLARVTAHEVFEAATDPGDDNSQGWISHNGQESNAGCNSPITLLIGEIGGAAGDTQGGTSRPPGYIPCTQE